MKCKSLALTLIFILTIINLKAQRSTIEPIDLIQSFGQGEVNLSPENKNTKAGNCVSIGYLKAAIEVFGINNIFEHYLHDDTYSIKLKDSSRFSFSQTELNKSILAADFSTLKRPKNLSPDKLKQYDEILKYAQIGFCVIVKNYQLKKSTSFLEALDEINQGLNVRCFPKLLGLQNYTEYQGWKGNDASRSGEVGWFKNHVVFTSNGVVDYYGEFHKKKPRRYPKRIKIFSTPFDKVQFLGEPSCSL